MGTIPTPAGGNSGPFMGVKPPILPASSMLVYPDGMVPGGTAVVLTASRYYYAWMWLDKKQTWAGAFTHDDGAGNNTHKIKIACFACKSDGSGGAPLSVAKNFGEATLDATEGFELLAASFTPSYTGWHILAMTGDNSATQIDRMSAGPTAGDGGTKSSPYGRFGHFSLDTGDGDALGGLMYQDGTYASFPEATPLAPDTSILLDGGTFPVFGLYS